MSTTVIFAELLVCGAQAALWMLLLGMAIFGKAEVVGLWKQYTTEIGAVLVVWAYSLGVVFDRVWDFCLKRYDKRIRRKHFKHDSDLHAIRKKVFSSDSELPAFVDYIRSRMRIARATLCNTLLCTITAMWLIAWESEGEWTKGYVAIIIAGMTLTAACMFAFDDITESYYQTLANFVDREPASSAKDHAPAGAGDASASSGSTETQKPKSK